GAALSFVRRIRGRDRGAEDSGESPRLDFFRRGRRRQILIQFAGLSSGRGLRGQPPPPGPLLAAQRPANLELVAYTNQSMRLRRLPVDRDPAGLEFLLRFRSRLEQTGNVEPHVETYLFGRSAQGAAGLGTKAGTTYAKMTEIRPITTMSNTLCLMVNLKRRPSSPEVMPVDATAPAILCTEIILPNTPAAEFTGAVRIGFSPRVFAVTTCRLPNSALADVSLPVRNTPSQPTTALKNGNARPDAASAGPSADVMPDQFIR